MTDEVCEHGEFTWWCSDCHFSETKTLKKQVELLESGIDRIRFNSIKRAHQSTVVTCNEIKRELKELRGEK